MMNGRLFTGGTSIDFVFQSLGPFQSQGASSGASFGFSMDDAGMISFSVPCGMSNPNVAYQVSSLNYGFNNGEPHSVIGSYDGSGSLTQVRIKLYVDGHLEAQRMVSKNELQKGTACSGLPSRSPSEVPEDVPVASVFPGVITDQQAAAHEDAMNQYADVPIRDSVVEVSSPIQTIIDQHGCIGYPGMLDWNVRLFSHASCSLLGGNRIGNGECLKPGGGSYSASLADLNGLCQEDNKYQNESDRDHSDYLKRRAFVELHDNCGGHAPASISEVALWVTVPTGISPKPPVRLFSRDECIIQLSGNWNSTGECIAQGGGSYTAMAGSWNSRCSQ
jgi:hypothetical protein